MKPRIELIISLENKVDLCFEDKKTCDNDGSPHTDSTKKKTVSFQLKKSLTFFSTVYC